MNVKIDVNISASPELTELFERLISAIEAHGTGHNNGATAESATEAKPKKEIKIATKKTAKPVAPEPEERVTLEEVSDMALKLANSGKRDEVKATLKEFGVAKVSLLEEEQYADFLAALNEF